VDESLDEMMTPHEGVPLRAMERIEYDIYNPAHHGAIEEMRHETFEELAKRVVEGVKVFGLTS